MAKNKTVTTTPVLGKGGAVFTEGAQDALAVQGTVSQKDLLDSILSKDPVNPLTKAGIGLIPDFLALDPSPIGRSLIGTPDRPGPFAASLNAVFQAGQPTQTELNALSRQPGQFAAPVAPQIAPSGPVNLFPDNFGRKQSPTQNFDLESLRMLTGEATDPSSAAGRLGITPGTPPSDNAIRQAVQAGDAFIDFTFDGQAIISKDVLGEQFFVGNTRVFSRDGETIVNLDTLVGSDILSPFDFTIGEEFRASGITASPNFAYTLHNPQALQELFDNGFVGADVQQQLISQGLAAQDTAGNMFAKGAQPVRFTPASELGFIDNVRPLTQPGQFLPQGGRGLFAKGIDPLGIRIKPGEVNLADPFGVIPGI